MMIGKNFKFSFYYIFLLFHILNYNFNIVIAIFPTSFNQINSTNGFRISETRTQITLIHGDINNDGNDDFIYSILGTGIYVFYGPLQSNFNFQTDYTKINGTNGFIFLNSNLHMGEVSVGDINNDGFDDIAFFINISPGKLGVVYGTDQIRSPFSFSTLDGNNGFYISHVSTKNVAFGNVKSIIDFNGDSIKDLFVSTSVGLFQSGTPIAYMLFGINGGKFPVNSQFEFNTSTFNGINGFVINDLQAFNSFPYDMNNDGFYDIMVNMGQTTIAVIYGSRGPFTSPYIPIFDGLNGTIFNFTDFSININYFTNGYGDFNGDGLNDFTFPVRANSNYYLNVIIYGKTKYPPFKNNTDSWTRSPRLADVNNDGFADLIIDGLSKLTSFAIMFGSNKNYTSNPIYLKDQVGNCLLQTISNGYSISTDIGDYNSDGIKDITLYDGLTSVGTYTVYGKTSIGSISIINKLFQPNPISNSNYNLFENNINLEVGECAVRIIILTIENPAIDDGFIIDYSFNSSIYSITNGNAKVTIELLLFGDETNLIVNDVLPKISVSLSPQLYNRTIIIKYGNQVQSIVFIGTPNANCNNKCLNGGSCDSIYGCKCVNGYYGDYCQLKDCTVPQCLNGGSCNKTVGECSCINGFYGNDCAIKDCTVPQCLNGGSCNTTIGECSCAKGYEGIDCSGISCSSSCLNGGLCNTTIGECSCAKGYEGIDCSGISCSHSCLNGGSCNTVAGECVCVQGYEGIDCSGISCSSFCLNGGSCNTVIGECSCINGFYGNDCATKNCTVPQCLNGGSCNATIGECSCAKGYEGIDCSGISCSSSCLNGGLCNTTIGECSCAKGYEGIDCSGISCSSSCLNGGSCDVSVGRCQCVDDYDGDDCGYQNKKKKTNIGVIIGPILGGLVLISIIVVAIVLIKKKKENSNKHTNNIKLKPQGSTVGAFFGGQINNLDKF
ncbi:hypothetical protein ACTA71_002617 [Dictyostelium dimigraforme]